jgi:anti-sigma factor (TIGR02949 family)
MTRRPSGRRFFCPWRGIRFSDVAFERHDVVTLPAEGNRDLMRCDDVRRTVYLFLEGALDQTKQVDFTAHIGLCPNCDTRTKIQQRLRIFIVRRLRPESAPERLKQRLLRTFRAIKAEWA